MKNILEGIKVIEVASMAAAPSATVILADLGAEVIALGHGGCPARAHRRDHEVHTHRAKTDTRRAR